MNQISLLSQETIDQIAAGEVVERPSSIVKELVENAIDAGANAITVEIKDGGTSLIRITDNGSGIAGEQVKIAFLRHATSKIRSLEDLLTSGTLGFRGEALSSIAAVCQVELITKTAGSLTGTRYVIEGGLEKSIEEIGAPEGTTFLVRNLFYNTPARKKFLKTAATEAGYISDLMERMAISHPAVSFKFINNNDSRLHTSGNCNLKDIIYGIYGRDIASNLVSIHFEEPPIRISGFIGKPIISRGNRNYENYFVNGRYVKSRLITRAIEDSYQSYLMNRRYPFTTLLIDIDAELVDVNVHPAKMDVRFSDQSSVYDAVLRAVRNGLAGKELVPEVTALPKEYKSADDSKKSSYPEPFEKIRSKLIAEANSPYEIRYPNREKAFRPVTGNITKPQQDTMQEVLFTEKLLDPESRKHHKLIGQIFDTYWLVEFDEKLYIIDQHAAHEKVMYEQFMEKLKKHQHTSQMITPPLIVTLSLQEEALLKDHMEQFLDIGFAIDPFGGRDYAVSAVPDNLYGIASLTLFTELLDGLTDVAERTSNEAVLEKIASMACKAAVKGNHRLSVQEADSLIADLLKLENPYNCPHGRPTIISMSKYELEKKFKRVL